MAGLLAPKATAVNKTPPATALRITSSIAGQPIPILLCGQDRISVTLIGYYDFTQITTKATGSGGGKGGVVSGGKGSSSGATITYSAAVLMALCEGPLNAILGVWENKSLATQETLAALGLTAFLGDYAQTAWGYMTTNHPSQALNYRGLSYVAGVLQLGSNPELPNLTFEIQAVDNTAISGLPDGDPMDALVNALTNVNYGVGFPSARIGDLSVWSDYCRAAGLVVSPMLSGGTALNSFIDDLMAATNSEIVFNGSTLTVVPYGDQPLSANGATYTPPSSPIYDVADVDFFPNTNNAAGCDDPVLYSRVDSYQQKNSIQLTFNDRENDYNPDVVTAKDDNAIAQYGLLPDKKDFSNIFKERVPAQLSAYLLLGRQMVRNLPTIVLGPEYFLLDPMDIIAATDSALGLDQQWIRLKGMDEQPDGTFVCAAEEYLSGTGHAPEYGQQTNSGYTPDYNADPGNARSPAIFDVPVALAEVIGLETWMGVCGANSTWGGCQVFVSTDNTTFVYDGTINGPSRMGVLSANFASGSDPDTTHTLSVNLSESEGTLSSGTSTDADQGNTLCFVDGEYVSYETATLTSANHYDLHTYLRRGMYGSPIGAHSSGSLFVRLDNSVYRRPYKKENVGQTIYIKLVSFNSYGGGLQDIGSVTSYAHVIGGPPVDYAPTGLTVTAGIKSTQLDWDNPADIGVAAVEVWRSASSAFGSAAQIADAPAYSTSWTDLSTGSNTAYWYWIRIRDIAGGFSVFDPPSSGAGASATTGQVQTADIANAAVTGPKIAAGVIPALLLAAGLDTVQVVSTLPATNAAGNIAFLTTVNGSIPAYNLYWWDATIPGWTPTVPAVAVGNGLTAAQIASVNGAVIAGNSIAAASIVTGSLTSSQMAAGGITAGTLAANSVTAGTLAANAVTTGTIAANAVTAGTVDVGAINASGIIVANIIVTGHLQANNITNTSYALNFAGDASIAVAVSPDAYAVIVTGTIFIPGGGAGDLLVNGSSLTGLTWNANFGTVTVQWVDVSSGGSTVTYSTTSTSGTGWSSIVVTQLLR